MRLILVLSTGLTLVLSPPVLAQNVDGKEGKKETTVSATGELSIRPTDGRPEGFDRVFSKQVDVFGLAV